MTIAIIIGLFVTISLSLMYHEIKNAPTIETEYDDFDNLTNK